MIISASYKTDIPAHYGAWFARRLDAGWCRVVNPWGGQVSTLDLTPRAVDGFLFWTRNIAPFRPVLDEVAERGLPFYVQYTVTGYPRALEAGVPQADDAVAAVCDLASRFGIGNVVWRYDPVVLTDATPPDWHRANFARLAGALAPWVDEVTLSFMHPYRKTRRNLDAAGLAWRDPTDDEKRAILADLAGEAVAHGLTPTLCTQPDLRIPPLTAARCIDAERLSRMAGRYINAPGKGYRQGCACASARDIGDYDTCAQGCVYCYAVSKRDTAKRRLRAHDPESPALRPRD